MKVKSGHLLVIALFVVFGLPELQAAVGASIGDKLPPYSLPELASEKVVNSKGLKGKVVLVDFWATWCAPCDLALVSYRDLYKEFKERGFVVVGINVDEEKDLEKAKRFAKVRELSYTLLRDGKEYAKAFDFKTMPTSFLVGPDGKIAYVHSGFRPGDAGKVREEIDKLLDKTAGGK